MFPFCLSNVDNPFRTENGLGTFQKIFFKSPWGVGGGCVCMCEGGVVVDQVK